MAFAALRGGESSLDMRGVEMRKALSLIAVLLTLTGCSGFSQSTSGSINSSTSGIINSSASPTISGRPVTSSASPTISGRPVTSSASPTISGRPVAALNAGTAYTFLPTASNATNGATLTFAIQNKPSWATFNASTGELAGTPGASEVGNYNGIEISVSDGAATSALPTFGISVTQSSIGSATLSWIPPTTNTNGTPLTNLAGYRIYYGTNSSSLNQSVHIANPGIASYAIDNLSPATWYFSVVSYNSANIESTLSEVVSKTITS
jgi:Putative Ig domain